MVGYLCACPTRGIALSAKRSVGPLRVVRSSADEIDKKAWRKGFTRPGDEIMTVSSEDGRGSCYCTISRAVFRKARTRET